MFWSRQCPAYVLGEDTPPWASTLYPFIHHFWQKWYLFHIPSIDKCYPFHIPSLEHFNCCKCTILLICVNNKTRKLSYLFTAIKYTSVGPFCLFTEQNDKFSYTGFANMPNLVYFTANLFRWLHKGYGGSYLNSRNFW